MFGPRDKQKLEYDKYNSKLNSWAHALSEEGKMDIYHYANALDVVLTVNLNKTVLVTYSRPKEVKVFFKNVRRDSPLVEESIDHVNWSLYFVKSVYYYYLPDWVKKSRFETFWSKLTLFH